MAASRTERFSVKSQAFGSRFLHRICHYTFCNQVSLHAIQTTTALRCASLSAPFSGVRTKKGDYIPLQHLQIVVVYVCARAEARVNAFINTAALKNAPRNPGPSRSCRSARRPWASPRFVNAGKEA